MIERRRARKRTADTGAASAMLALLVPVRAAHYGELAAPAQFDWAQSSYALVDATSPSADWLRQLVATQEGQAAGGHGLESLEQLFASAGIERLAHRLADDSQRERVAEPLSRREEDVLRLIVAGHSNQEIAQSLMVAVSTVKMHIKHIYSKLGVSNRAQAIAHAWSLQVMG